MPDEVDVTANAETGIGDADIDALLADDSATDTTESPELDETGEPLDALEALNEIPPEFQEEQPQEQPVEEQPQPEQPQGEELPEGVEMAKDDRGRPFFKLRANRYRTFHDAHKTVRALEPIFGQPLTPDTAPKVIGQAVSDAQGWSNFRSDFVSADPQAQGEVVNYLLNRAEQAVRSGETSQDPLIPFSQQFVSTLRERNSAAYAQLAAPVLQDIISEIYQEAVNGGDENLLRSVQRIDHKINGGYRTADEIKAGLDPTTQRERLLQQREQRLQQEESRRMTEQWQNWVGIVERNEQAQVASAIDAALQGDAPKFEKYPKLFADVKESLRKAVYDNIKADAILQNALSSGMQRAHRASSAAVRDQIANELIGRVINRAQMVIRDQKADIIRERAKALKAQSDANHQRRQQAVKQTAPSGGGTPVRRSIVPNGADSDYEVATASSMEKDALRALGL